jgi:TetR/AcrR family transcriptional regulator
VSASRKAGPPARPRKRRPAASGHGAGSRSAPTPRGSVTRRARVEDERSTSERILDAALVSFADRGYEATSLDALAAGLEVRKQTILYWFPSKERLLESVVDRSAGELSRVLEEALAAAGPGFARVEAVVRSVFRLAARRPELLGLLREVGRLGSPVANRFIEAMDPLVQRATEFLEAEMDAGNMRRHEPRLLLLAIYSTVIGMVTEVEVLRALGEEPTARSLVRRRSEIIELLRSALLVEDRPTTA